MGKSGVEMVLEDVRIREVDGVRLVGVFGDVREMQPQGFAQTAELNFALMLQAKLERLLCDLLRIHEWI